MTDDYAPCDLCAAPDRSCCCTRRAWTARLVRCRQCSLVYVGRRSQNFTFAATDAWRSQPWPIE